MMKLKEIIKPNFFEVYFYDYTINFNSTVIGSQFSTVSVFF